LHSELTKLGAYACAADHNIRGNNQSHIHHLRDSPYYKATIPAACFATAADAEAAVSCREEVTVAWHAGQAGVIRAQQSSGMTVV